MRLATEDLVGATLGRVRIDARLGEGAVGTVYRGHHTTLGLDVAVKVLKSDNAGSDPEYRERFRREARLAARLEHPGLVRVIDFGEEDGVLYLVMDLVDGFSLDRFLSRRKDPMTELTVLKLLLAVALGMQTAHGAGIIHRDLKPANILISRKGQLRVTDLGLARETGMPGLTREKVSVGSPAYMAPESLSQGMPSDHRIDIYALGVIAYQLAFRHMPYTGDLQQTIQGHLGGNARWDRPTVCSRECIRIIKKLMAHAAEDRYQSMAAAAADLRRLLQTRQRKARRKAGGGASGSNNNAGTGSSSDFSGFGAFLESRLGSYTSEHDGGQVIHTTLRERVMVWILLTGIAAVMTGGYLVFG
ncbi:MAG: serine/threonine-protein kinase [Planctomycetota bacterium]|jgi:serine/threonine protein kinase|nr:serine/threonine-protein kinase [Planctomycetota bacterium]